MCTSVASLQTSEELGSCSMPLWQCHTCGGPWSVLEDHDRPGSVVDMVTSIRLYSAFQPESSLVATWAHVPMKVISRVTAGRQSLVQLQLTYYCQ
jgi:hypothetical protein